MKQISTAMVLIFVVALSSISSQIEAAPFPLNFDLDSLRKAGKSPETFNDEIVAFKGRVTRLFRLSDGSPYFFLQFHNPNPDSLGIWVSSSTNVKEGAILVGHDMAVLGFFLLIDPDEKAIKAIHNRAYHVVGFCIANATTQTGIYATEGNNRCMEWQNGSIPKVAGDTTSVRIVKPGEKK